LFGCHLIYRRCSRARICEPHETDTEENPDSRRCDDAKRDEVEQGSKIVLHRTVPLRSLAVIGIIGKKCHLLALV